MDENIVCSMIYLMYLTTNVLKCLIDHKHSQQLLIIVGLIGDVHLVLDTNH